MIKAIDNKIIVAELKRSKTTGGIVIPSTVTEPQAYGKILSIGEGVTNKNLKLGSVIVYHKMGGQAISMKNKIYCCVPYPEVYGILTDEDTLKELQEIEITEPKEAPAKMPAPSLIQRV